MTLNDGTPLKLYLTRYRLYSATLNRFLSSDHIGLEGGLNLYEYGLSNPLESCRPCPAGTIAGSIMLLCGMSGSINLGSSVCRFLKNSGWMAFLISLGTARGRVAPRVFSRGGRAPPRLRLGRGEHGGTPCATFMDDMDGMDKMERATARVAPTAFAKTPEGVGRTRSCASALPGHCPEAHLLETRNWQLETSPEGTECPRACASV